MQPARKLNHVHNAVAEVSMPIVGLGVIRRNFHISYSVRARLVGNRSWFRAQPGFSRMTSLLKITLDSDSRTSLAPLCTSNGFI